MTRDEFIAAIDVEMCNACGLNVGSMHQEAKDVMDSFEQSEAIFGSDGYSWDAEAAAVIAQEEMSYWEGL